MMTDPLNGLRGAVTASVHRPDAAFAAKLRQRIEAIEARIEPSAGPHWHLAQLNLGIFKYPLDAPEMDPFVMALDRINAIADASPGFVWRLTDDDGGPSSNVEVPGAEDPLLASNLSVWTDYESLRQFMYRSDHGSYMRRRAEWFEKHDEAMTIGWWIPAGEVPTLEDAVRRLEYFRSNGPSDEAFALNRREIPDPPDQSHLEEDMSNTSTGTAETSTAARLRSSVVPYLTASDARAAIDFYAEVFGAVPSGEVFDMPDGRLGHAEFMIGNQLFYIADEFVEMKLQGPAALGGNSISMVIEVEDCDATYEHAVAAGATGERPPDNAHGFRSGWFVDPWGHRWSPTSAVR